MPMLVLRAASQSRQSQVQCKPRLLFGKASVGQKTLHEISQKQPSHVQQDATFTRVTTKANEEWHETSLLQNVLPLETPETRAAREDACLR